MTTVAATPSRRYLAVPGGQSLVRDVALVLGGTLFLTIAAFVAVPLPFTPVPVSLATFAVLATGASLGPLRGALSAGVYLLMGALGAPVFAGGQSGVLLPTLGYVIGYVLAAAVVGGFARRGADRRVGPTLALAAAGSAIVYLCGAPWLAASLGIDLGQALQLGVVPFLIGDALKIVLLGAVLPTAWRLVRRVERGS